MRNSFKHSSFTAENAGSSDYATEALVNWLLRFLLRNASSFRSVDLGYDASMVSNPCFAVMLRRRSPLTTIRGVRLFLGLRSFAKPCSSTACGELALVLEFVAIGPHQSAELTVQVGDVRGGDWRLVAVKPAMERRDPNKTPATNPHGKGHRRRYAGERPQTQP
jgi:hypothetical protein